MLVGTNRVHGLHFKPGTWLTAVACTAKEDLPMPWKELHIMDQREQCIREWVSGE